jgi:putative PIN family toxin of toxin-antitoxin system
MIRRAVVIDTNVIISAHLTSRPESPTVWILDAMIAARFPFLVSVELLAEYRRVLLRQPIREKHGVSADKVDKMLTELALNGIVVEPPPTSASPPDPGDQHLWDLLAARPGAVLVTGDAGLIQGPPDGASILSPRGFVGLATRR